MHEKSHQEIKDPKTNRNLCLAFCQLEILSPKS
uniref:Uncharacterized protein n=1 Tax=Arundo donax TaxID=35708 RepID=A0A0A9C2X7_ARUDO